jgi:DNA-binding NtrC family response regulator
MTRILVVDDNVSVRTTARILLETAGYQVVEAESGEAALEVLGSEDVEVVLTDIFMPHTDGIELIHTLHRTSPGLPIVAMSGGGKDVLSVARLLGAAVIVEKPLTQRKLVGAIRRAIERPRVETESQNEAP